MKKLFVSFMVLFLATGCDGNMESLSCTNTTTQNGIMTTTSYMYDYVDDQVKNVTITYDYSRTDENVDGVDADTDGLTEDDSNSNARNGNNTDVATNNGDNTNNATNSTNNNNTNSNNNNNTNNSNTNNNTNNNTREADDVVDGVVGDAIDSTVDEVTDVILDIAGIKNNYERQLSTYDNVEGFSYEVDVDNDDEYRITYKIDMDKISDTDLAMFNVSRSFDDIQSNYEDLGYTCK